MQLDPAVAAAMRARAQAIRERQAQGSFTRSWSLSGKNAVVEPGKAVVIRLMPRWDIANKFMAGPNNTRVPNPDYVPGFFHVEAKEHWWDFEGKTKSEYCPTSVDSDAYCVVCAASQALTQSSSKDDRDQGKRIKANEVFIFNAVVGNPRRAGDDKLADIRILKCSAVQYNQISDIMNGSSDDAEQRAFALGDITDPREGYDLLFKRPPSAGGERWTVRAAPAASPLYQPAEAASFKAWHTRLTDLEEMLDKEVKDAAGIFKAYYGRDPEPQEIGLAEAPADVQPAKAAAPQTAQQPEQQESAEPPTGPDDAFMGLQPPSQQKPAPPAQVPPAARQRAPRR